MNKIQIAFALFTLGVTSLPISSINTAAIAATEATISGSWSGPLLGYVWTFEFTRAGDSITGRYKTSKSNKWSDLDDVIYKNGVVQFSFESKPPSSFKLEMNASGKTMAGSAKFGELPLMPITLTRGS